MSVNFQKPTLLRNSGPNGDKAQYLNPETKSASSKLEADNAFSSKKSQAYNEIYAHEMAHLSAAGSQGSGLKIFYNQDGVATAGKVDINMPTSVNKAKPEETRAKAQVAYNAALAPGDPSGQDNIVAGRAMQIISMADHAIAEKGNNSGKNLNLVG